jgi:hypothetical protein
MVNRIIEFSARNRFLIITLVGAAALAGWWSMKHVSLDSIPDLSDTQVIIYSRWDRSPDIIEAQVTYPIVSAPLARATGEGGARLLGFRLFVCLRRLPGRHRLRRCPALRCSRPSSLEAARAIRTALFEPSEDVG